jgi:hypothetical protein
VSLLCPHCVVVILCHFHCSVVIVCLSKVGWDECGRSGLVLESPVQSGFLTQNEKTETRTGPHTS